MVCRFSGVAKWFGVSSAGGPGPVVVRVLSRVAGGIADADLDVVNLGSRVCDFKGISAHLIDARTLIGAIETLFCTWGCEIAEVTIEGNCARAS